MINVPKFDPIPDELRSRILSVCDFKCKMCGAGKRKLDIHHIVPRSQGGLNSINNLIPLCKPCHRRYEASNSKSVIRKSTITHITYANTTSNSLRTTVPMSVMRALDLDFNCKLKWEIIDGKTIRVGKQTDAS